MIDPPEMELPLTAQWATILRDCVCQALVDEGVPPCRCSLVPGLTAAWDVCCECSCSGDDCKQEGQVWVSVPSIFPTMGGGTTFPGVQATGFQCGNGVLAAQYQVGILRCAKSFSIDGKIPDADRLDFEAVRSMQDHQSMMRAILCCFLAEHYPEEYPWSLGAWTALGPEGGCVGGMMTLTIVAGAIPVVGSDGKPCGNC